MIATRRQGRRVTLKLDAAGGIWGMLPLLDGQAMQTWSIASGPATLRAIPCAIRVELSRSPQSIT